MKAKFYVILIDTKVSEAVKSSVYFGGFSPSKLMSDTEIIETNIPNAVKYDTKAEAESMCSIIKEYMEKNEAFNDPHIYIEEIEAEYKIQTVIEFLH